MDLDFYFWKLGLDAEECAMVVEALYGKLPESPVQREEDEIEDPVVA